MFIAWVAYLWWRPPPPGVSIAILAVAAVLITLWAERNTKLERVLWILVAFGLLLCEIRATYRERKAEHDRFQHIADGIAKSMQQNQEHFDASIEALTGGSSYPVVSLGFSPDPRRPLHLLAEIRGTKYPGKISYAVEQLTGRVRPNSSSNLTVGPTPDNCIFYPFRAREIGAGDTGPLRAFPAFPPDVLPLIIGPALGETTHYRIRMQLKNGRFVQCMDVRYDRRRQAWDSRSVIWRGDVPIVVQRWPR